MKKILLNDKYILFLILLNAFIIFIGGFNVVKRYNSLIDIIDDVITVLFVLELYFKINKYRFRGYFSSYWNVFDFILIVISIPALIYSVLGIDFSSLSFILVLRVFRVFKSFRFIKFIPGIEHIIKGVKRAMKASFLILLAFIVYIFIIGVLSFNLFHTNSPEYFGNPMKAMYSIFKIFTIEGWYEIPESIVIHYGALESFLIYMYFILILISGGILGLSLVNSVFVDAMVSDNNNDIYTKLNIIEQKLNQINNELKN